MKIAIIGGGYAGLSTAYYLQKNIDAEIDIYEKDLYAGGLAGAKKIGNTYIEKYYHHIFTHDSFCLDLINELGLTDRLIWKNTKMAYLCNGIVYPFTTPLDIIKFRPLSFINRIRFGLSSLYLSWYKYSDKLEQMTAEDFMVKIVGKQVWEKIWKAMLVVKFGENYNKIPAVWLWERIVQRFRSRSGSGQKEVLGYMEGSFNTLTQTLLDKVVSNGGNLFLNSDITDIIIENNCCKGIKINGEEKLYDFVICTAALPVFVDLCKTAPKDYIEPLSKVNYDCALVVLLYLKQSLSDIYWLNVSDSEFPFGGLIEHTNFISKEVYEGKAVFYFSRYLSANDNLLEMQDIEVVDIYLKYLKKIHPHFEESMIDKYFVFKDRYAQPIWPLNYSKIKPSYKTPIKGLYLSNTSQIYPNDRGINFSIKLGKEVVESFLKDNS